MAEHGVQAVKMGRGNEAQEELRAIGVWPSIRHGKDSPLVVLLVGCLQVLIVEVWPVDALSAGAVAFGEISSLSHEARDDAVEVAALVGEEFARLSHDSLSGAELSEVF